MRRTALLLTPFVLLACSRDANESAPAPFHRELDGFSTPESVQHDPVDDVYLVSNINGDPLAEDDNGFISRLSPDGKVIERRWIDGGDDGVTLNAPKGMTILGDTLYVADIDCVRMFERASGTPAGEVCFDEATFLNDVASDADGALYVTDTGFRAGANGFESSGTDAIYRFSPDGRYSALARGPGLGGPNGITFGSRGGLVVTFGSGEIYRIQPDGMRVRVLPPVEGRQLDGIVSMPEGGFVFTSWGERSVLWVSAQGKVTHVLDDVDGPADLGYDAGRNRVLVPLFNDNTVVIQELPAAAAHVPEPARPRSTAS